MDEYKISTSSMIRDNYDRNFNTGHTTNLLGLNKFAKDVLTAEYTYYDNKNSDQIKVVRGRYIKRFSNGKEKYKIFLTGNSHNENLLQFLPYSAKELKHLRLNMGQIPSEEQFKFMKYYKKELLEFKPDIVIVGISAGILPIITDFLRTKSMLFSSMTFVFMFLPIVCAIYLLVRPEIRNYILLAASMLFYAWGEPKYLAIMILTILVNYTGANYISRSRNLIHRKLLLVATILVDLSFLFYFKYFNFVLDNINHLFHTHIDFIDVIMPIGISFYTFQALSYVVDVYRGEVKAQRDIYKLALYITLFPQLVAGPIVKYHDVAEQISCRTVTFDKVAYGVKRFIIGLAKKC